VIKHYQAAIYQPTACKPQFKQIPYFCWSIQNITYSTADCS